MLLLFFIYLFKYFKTRSLHGSCGLTMGPLPRDNRCEPSTSQGYERGCSECISLDFVCGLAWAIFEVKMGSTCWILKHGSWVIFRDKFGMKYPLNYSNIMFEERDAHGNVMFYPPKTYL